MKYAGRGLLNDRAARNTHAKDMIPALMLPGELAIPPDRLSSKTLEAIKTDLRGAGIEYDDHIVGSDTVPVDPETGLPMFNGGGGGQYSGGGGYGGGGGGGNEYGGDEREAREARDLQRVREAEAQRQRQAASVFQASQSDQWQRSAALNREAQRQRDEAQRQEALLQEAVALRQEPRQRFEYNKRAYRRDEASSPTAGANIATADRTPAYKRALAKASDKEADERLAAKEKTDRDAGPQKRDDEGFLSSLVPAGVKDAFSAAKSDKNVSDIIGAFFNANDGEMTAKLLPSVMVPFASPLMSIMRGTVNFAGGMLPPSAKYTTEGVQVPGADPGVLGELTWADNAKLFGRQGHDEQDDKKDYDAYLLWLLNRRGLTNGAARQESSANDLKYLLG